MEYVLDTNIVSEIAKPHPDPCVVAWIQDHENKVGITSVTLEELYSGIFRLPDGKRKAVLKETIDAVVKDCTDKTLSFDAFCGYICAQVRQRCREAGRVGTIEDYMIAAICLRNNMTLVTRNTKDFDYIDGLRILNPFDYEG